jgi:hypothetical protein
VRSGDDDDDDDGSQEKQKLSIQWYMIDLYILLICIVREHRRMSNINLLYALVRSHDSICTVMSHRYITNLFMLQASDVEGGSGARRSQNPPLSPLDRSQRAGTYQKQISLNRQILTTSDIVELTKRSYAALERAVEDGEEGGSGLHTAAEALKVLETSIGEDLAAHTGSSEFKKF